MTSEFFSCACADATSEMLLRGSGGADLRAKPATNPTIAAPRAIAVVVRFMFVPPKMKIQEIIQAEPR
jgi:hypothetical protein